MAGFDTSKLPDADKDWTENNWFDFISHLVALKIVSYKEIGALLLGHINPPQVGTSIASNKNFQKHYPPRKTWMNVKEWYYNQTGECADCGTRLELQADHIIPRQELGDNADRLDNITLRCRRCNVIRRPSHKKGGLTYLTAESALMWLLFFKRPKDYDKFKKMCRQYGLTMADIRFQEAWAMAKWLEQLGLYTIQKDEEGFIPDTEIPKRDENTSFPEDAPPM